MEDPATAPAEPAGGEEPAPSFARRVVDPVNSVVWFAMDACWMGKLEWPAYAFAALAVGTGVWLLLLGRRQERGVLFADLGLSCWIAMNTIWLVSDLNSRPTPFAVTVPLAALGAVFIGIAVWRAEDVRRLRLGGR